MKKRKRHLKNRAGLGKNAWRMVVLVGFWIVVLGIVLLIDLKPWRRSPATQSKEWPFRDLTHGDYATDFEGIDISRHQGKIHWEEMEKNESLRFVYIKATEGSSIVDPFYINNVEAARKHGYKVGSYHFLTKRSAMKKQVENFLSAIDTSRQDLLPVVDIEEDGTRGWDRPIIQRNLAEFIRLVKERTGKAPMIYTNEAYYQLNLHPEFSRYRLFIANYNLPPTITGARYDIWQRSKRGRVHGIWNWTDINELREGLTLDELAW